MRNSYASSSTFLISFSISKIVDLVLEMPLHISLSSAEMFGEGSVSLISSLGCVNSLCFGAECDDVSQLEKIAAEKQVVTLWNLGKVVRSEIGE
mgnify:CR=1 FL=1